MADFLEDIDPELFDLDQAVALLRRTEANPVFTPIEDSLWIELRLACARVRQLEEMVRVLTGAGADEIPW